MTTTSNRIRELNDELRKHFLGGLAVITPSVAALGPSAVDRIAKTVSAFDDFHHDNDPHQEHDFGEFDIGNGVRVIFKIDYYDPSLTVHSSDPADPQVTERVITIMLASEY